jgi:hypothetical protein
MSSRDESINIINVHKYFSYQDTTPLVVLVITHFTFTPYVYYQSLDHQRHIKLLLDAGISMMDYTNIMSWLAERNVVHIAFCVGGHKMGK